MCQATAALDVPQRPSPPDGRIARYVHNSSTAPSTPAARATIARTERPRVHLTTASNATGSSMARVDVDAPRMAKFVRVAKNDPVARDGEQHAKGRRHRGRRLVLGR